MVFIRRITFFFDSFLRLADWRVERFDIGRTLHFLLTFSASFVVRFA